MGIRTCSTVELCTALVGGHSQTRTDNIAIYPLEVTHQNGAVHACYSVIKEAGQGSAVSEAWYQKEKSEVADCYRRPQLGL